MADGELPQIELRDAVTPDADEVPRSSSMPLPLARLALVAGLLIVVLAGISLASEADPELPTGRPVVVEEPTTPSGDVESPDSQEPAADLRYECNASGSECLLTSPNGEQVLICIAPCPGRTEVEEGEGVRAIVLGGSAEDGEPAAGVEVTEDGGLEVLSDGDDAEVGYFAFDLSNDGRIEMTMNGDTPPVRTGGSSEADSSPGSDEDTADEQDGPTQPDPDDPADAEADDAGSDGGGDLLRSLAPILLVAGGGLVGFGVISLARRDREDDDGPMRPDVPVEPAELEPREEAQDDLTSQVAATAAEERVRIVTDLIDDLRAEPDPAVAIQRAYAALETGFGNPTLARRSSETCSTYLHRTIGVVGNVSAPLRTLTMLFELARYSTESIEEHMRTEALEALVEVREAWKGRSGVPIIGRRLP